MNPMAQEALGAIVRWALMLVAGYIVQAGIWTGADAERYVGAATLAVLALGWSLWQKYRSRRKLVVALASTEPLSERDVKEQIAAATIVTRIPSVKTPANVVPTEIKAS